ncbi:MAG: hypothetical protein BWY15_00846 [Firmicutes bacterium ADurb.Bin193]|nr:MAG: hypothetical protein BWY15_00846 [Firmicutes bacterium ADurb.Bin193]
MVISYDKLWKLLVDKKMTKTQFRLATNIGTATLARLGKEQPVRMEILLKICGYFKCNISDIMDFIIDQGGSDHE